MKIGDMVHFVNDNGIHIPAVVQKVISGDLLNGFVLNLNVMNEGSLDFREDVEQDEDENKSIATWHVVESL